MRIGLALFTTFLLANPLVATAQNDTVVARELSRGVVYRQFVDKTGPFVVHLVRVNLREPTVELRAMRAHDALRTRERTTDMVRRLQQKAAVLVAVNADFFNLQTGENENNQVIDGEWWKGVKNTDSPYDTYDNAHVQFGLDARRRPLIDRFLFDGRVWAHGVMTPIITLNFHQLGNPENVVLYTSRFGATTPGDTTRPIAEAAMLRAGTRGDTVLYVRRGAVRDSSGSPIPVGGAVLAAYGAGSRLKEVQSMVDGDTVKILLATLPRLSPSASPTLIIGGWPRILRNGEVVVAEAPVQEGTISRNAEARHTRTAIGFSRDSSTLYLLAVDGRQEASVGMTLAELAALMRRLGAWNAMNFDGGGSTTMVVGGAVVNKPSDATGEREIGNALAVVKRP